MAELDDKELQRYENLLLKAQQHKTPERELTIFDTAVNSHYENPTTELLAFFLDPEQKHGLGSSFYNGFIEVIRDLSGYQDIELGQFVQLQTQQSTQGNKFIDLWLETDSALIIVEIKVHHIQNNPFDDYVVWGKEKLAEINKDLSESATEKQLVLLILSPNGVSRIKQWSGLSFTDLSENVQRALGSQLIANPLSKWLIFARDFLLHLNSFHELLDLNMEKVNFVVENMKSIQELVNLREECYQEIIDHINNKIQEKIEDYKVGMRRHNWDGTPALRFIGNHWKDWSDTVLNLHVNESPMSCSVNMYIQHPTDEIVKKAKVLLKKSPFPISEQRYEQNNKFWGAHFKFNAFNLEEVTQLIIFTQQILNKVETEWK
ncbi:PD-(D/E)XK nuclease family protein [Acinetobacter sp. PW68]|uniref:PD-(D/E)XK nuclease family protein n=1 Tax=Acinetobacter sp. PW68 TaxID=2865162 RepID=UPI001E3B84AF|nr:PD-(D/E)XK nuclease family protein [Acinetobacter sp. PW68]MCD0189079.1 PD-(D/E)XK nuclease family protein [Acinetobacter sp. PW68]